VFPSEGESSRLTRGRRPDRQIVVYDHGLNEDLISGLLLSGQLGGWGVHRRPEEPDHHAERQFLPEQRIRAQQTGAFCAFDL